MLDLVVELLLDLGQLLGGQGGEVDCALLVLFSTASSLLVPKGDGCAYVAGGREKPFSYSWSGVAGVVRKKVGWLRMSVRFEVEALEVEGKGREGKGISAFEVVIFLGSDHGLL